MPDDPRIRDLLQRGTTDPKHARAVLIGFPSDEGVRRNGGRPGASEAPTAIRNALYSMTADPRVPAMARFWEEMVDGGNVSCTGDVEADQQALARRLAPHLRRGCIPIILGGGHETAFGHFLGYVEAEQSVGITNWDAHPDVRPLRDGQAHSGSPFRQALTHPDERCTGYAVFGLQPHSTARAHLDYVQRHNATVVWNDALTTARINAHYDAVSAPQMVTFDLDAVDQGAAPGVSAPAVNGMPSRLWLHAAYRAGRCPHVRSMDIVEHIPRFDADHRTARLAAYTIWQFVRGLVQREA